MPFRPTQETLEALEWPGVVARLREACRTAVGRELLEAEVEREPEDVRGPADDSDPMDSAHSGHDPDALGPEPLFLETATQVRLRLAQTSEARALLDAEQIPPLGGVTSLRDALQRASVGGVLESGQLLEVRTLLQTLQSVAQFLAARAEGAPRLADLAACIEGAPELEREIERCIDPSGEIRDAASSALATARRDSVRLGGELQSRLARFLQDPAISAHLSDAYYTQRGDRYVLPVRSDARGHVRGIVHDASRSGATLFIEPEAAVELNNRLKQAELTVVREIERVLRDLSGRVAAVAPALRVGLAALARIDVAFARGRLSQQMSAVEPEVGEDGRYVLPLLRHPLIDPAECVANDLRLGDDFGVLILSGPNAGGKTVAMKSFGLAALCARAGLHVASAPGARVSLADPIIAEIGDGQDIGESLSTFSAHMASLARVVRSAGPGALVVMDEIGVGTDPSEGAALAQAILEALAGAGARVIVTTHYNLLKEMAEVDPRFANASVEFDPETLMPTYRLHIGTPGASSAATVAARMGMPTTVLDRAEALLQHEDRQLDRMLSELAASRASLESEQEQAARLRAESEASRDEYRARLERMQERRDQLYLAMRDDLDRAFEAAHGEVARVIRDLQRAGGAQDAAKARTELLALAQQAADAQEEAGVKPAEERAPGHVPIDWRRAKAGDPIRVRGGRPGLLVEGPDRKGRVCVQVGSAKLVLPSEQVGQGPRNEPAPEPRQRVAIERVDAADDEGLEGGTLQCDLRGQRVEEALDRLAECIDRAAIERRDLVRVVHGHGTGALRRAVREHLRASPFVKQVRKADDDEGGDGVTLAELG